MQKSGVLLERKDRIAVITFTRPNRRNAFDEHMWTGLEWIVWRAEGAHPRAVRWLPGAGKGFCCTQGFDVNPDNPQSKWADDCGETAGARAG